MTSGALEMKTGVRFSRVNSAKEREREHETRELLTSACYYDEYLPSKDPTIFIQHFQVFLYTLGLRD